MNINTFKKALLPLAVSLAIGPAASVAAVLVQCPGDKDGSADWGPGETQPVDTKCMHQVN